MKRELQSVVRPVNEHEGTGPSGVSASLGDLPIAWRQREAKGSGRVGDAPTVNEC